MSIYDFTLLNEVGMQPAKLRHKSEKNLLVFGTTFYRKFGPDQPTIRFCMTLKLTYLKIKFSKKLNFEMSFPENLNLR